MAGEEKKRPPPPPPRPDDPEEEAHAAAAKARVERFVIMTLAAAFLIFAWSLLRKPVRAPSPGTEPPALVEPP